MKLIFQIIGFVFVALLLIGAVFFFLDSKNLLQGDLGAYVHTMHQYWTDAKNITLSFMQNSGIANDAADILDHGAEILRSPALTASSDIPVTEFNVTTATPSPIPTETPPAIIIITPEVP